MADIVSLATKATGKRDASSSYPQFLKDLAKLICKHFGGRPGSVGFPDNDLGWTVGFHINENVPLDGGVFRYYDTDVIWKDGVETEA